MEEIKYEQVNLTKNCLKVFILRIDFFPQAIETFIPAVEKISPFFDRLEKRAASNIAFQIKDGNAKVSQNLVYDYVLVSEQKNISLTFSDVQNSVWIESKRYTDNNVYKDTVKLIQDTFQDIKPDIASRRIGMRYVNEFKCSKINDISRIFTRRLSSVVRNILVNKDIMRAICQEEYNYSDSLLSGYKSNKFNWIESSVVNSCSLMS